MDQDSANNNNNKLNKSPVIKITSAYSMESNKSPTEQQHQRQGDNKPKPGQTNNNSSGTSSASSSSSISSSSPAQQQQQQQPPTDVVEASQNAIATTATATATGADKAKNKATHAYKRRWLMLAIFCAHSAINSFQWIQYSSITNIVSGYYGVSNLAVNITSLVYMITYIPFIIHASLMLERVGLKYAICLGATGTALGSFLKLEMSGEPTPTNFWLMMTGQTIVALSQLFIISIPPLLAAVWFPDHQVSTATGIGVFGNQLGIALGFIVPPWLISDSSASKKTIGNELYSLEYRVAVISMVIFLVSCIFIRDRPPKPPGSASLHAAQQHLAEVNGHAPVDNGAEGGSGGTQQMETFASIRELCRDRDFRLLTLSYGINVGCFYAVSTVLNQMLARSWPNPDDLAGTMGLLIVVSGMAGSVMCGQLLDRTHAFKLIIVLIYLLSLVSMLIFTLVLRLLAGPWPLYIVSITLGFFMTGYLPLGFEFAAEITYPHPANTPAGLLNLSAQIFGLALTYGSSMIVDKPNGDLWANFFLTGCLAVGLVLTFIMKADLKRQKAVAEERIKS